jgi:hypothetical protein
VEVCAPLHAPGGAPGGALRLRLRLRPAPPQTTATTTTATSTILPPPAEAALLLQPLAGGEAQQAAELAGGGSGVAADNGSSFASWMSVLQEMSDSFNAREGLPEDPEHPDGTGPEHPASLRRRDRGAEAGAAAAAAEGLLPPSPDDVATDVPFDDGGADDEMLFRAALPPAAPPYLRGGVRFEELRDEADAPDADGEDERAAYFKGDLAQRQDYGPEEEDPYAMTSEDEA